MTIYWTVRKFPWEPNDCKFISLLKLVSNSLYLLVLEYVLVIIYYCSTTIVLSFEISWKFVMNKVFFERIVCDYRSLTVLFTQCVWEVNPFYHGVQVMLLCCNFKIWGLKTYFWCFDGYQFFYILPPLLKGPYQDSLNNHELFWDKNWKWTFRESWYGPLSKGGKI